MGLIHRDPHHFGWVHCAVWSPCGQFIAVHPQDKVEIRICDSTTLEGLSVLEFPSTHPFPPSNALPQLDWVKRTEGRQPRLPGSTAEHLLFPWWAPVGQYLLAPEWPAHRHLDVQSGIIIKDITTEPSHGEILFFRTTHNSLITTESVHTYDIHSGAQVCEGRFPPGLLVCLGVRGSLRFATCKIDGEHAIEIREIQPT